MKLKLNVKKIKKEGERLGLTQSGLARKMGWSRQRLNYVLKKKLIIHTDQFGKIFDIEPKDLLL